MKQLIFLSFSLLIIYNKTFAETNVNNRNIKSFKYKVVENFKNINNETNSHEKKVLNLKTKKNKQDDLFFCRVTCSVQIIYEDGTSGLITAKGGGLFQSCETAGFNCAWNLYKKLRSHEIF